MEEMNARVMENEVIMSGIVKPENELVALRKRYRRI